MEIARAKGRASRQGPPEWFTGTVRVEPLAQAAAPGRMQSALVTFQPGARTHWHTHPLGQALYVTVGEGLAQVWGGPVQRILTGDTVWFPGGEKHWHGASADQAMSHVAMQEAQDGKAVDWLEPVTDAQYRG